MRASIQHIAGSLLKAANPLLFLIIDLY